MKIAAAFVALTHATQDGDTWFCWPANDDAPLCGCQWITREHNMVGEMCTLTFPNAPEDFLQMLTVASSFPIPMESDLKLNTYIWTGIQGLSHQNLHDIVYFLRKEQCDLFDFDDAANKPVLSCADIPDPGPGYHPLAPYLPLLGNFNYDVARSHQSYNLPIYGLITDNPLEVRVLNHSVNTGLDDNLVAIRNVTAHHGHGSVTDHTICDNLFEYTLNVDDKPPGTIGHHGELEYANFYLCDDPTVSKKDAPGDYEYNVPSSWTTTVFQMLGPP